MSISVLQADIKKNINLRFNNLTLDGTATIAGTPVTNNVLQTVIRTYQNVTIPTGIYNATDAPDRVGGELFDTI